MTNEAEAETTKGQDRESPSTVTKKKDPKKVAAGAKGAAMKYAKRLEEVENRISKEKDEEKRKALEEQKKELESLKPDSSSFFEDNKTPILIGGAILLGGIYFYCRKSGKRSPSEPLGDKPRENRPIENPRENTTLYTNPMTETTGDKPRGNRKCPVVTFASN